MLLGHIVLLVHIPLERSENITPLEEVAATLALEVDEGVVRDAGGVGASVGALGRNREVLEFLTENNDGLLGEERVLRWRRVALTELRRRRAVDEVLLGMDEPR
jgi:hypothetical protein